MKWWNEMKPKNRMVLIICLCVVAVTLIVCAAATGTLDVLIGAFSTAAK